MFMEFDPSRRLFLRRAGIATVAPVIAPVLPIEKIVKYFFAPSGGWGSLFGARHRENNAFLSPSFITTEALKILHANLKFGTTFDEAFEYDFPKIGKPIQIRMPKRFAPTLPRLL